MGNTSRWLVSNGGVAGAGWGRDGDGDGHTLSRQAPLDRRMLGLVLDALDEFHKCDNSEKVSYLTPVSYVLLLDSLFNIHCSTWDHASEDIVTLTKRFLRLTENSMEDTNKSLTNVHVISIHLFLCRYNKVDRGDNVLHIACREIPFVFDNEDCNNRREVRKKGLAEFLRTLHVCGEDVNAQNVVGMTPLHVLLCDHHVFRDSF